jgi:Acetyltransferases
MDVRKVKTLMEYKILNALEVNKYKESLIYLMNIILKDNITQDFPADQAERYVNRIPNYIENGSAIVVGAIIDGVLIGFSWAYELDIFGERRVHIDMIGVHPDHRKCGIAKNLVNIQIEETKKRGISKIEAMTTKSNENSYKWFHSMGFTDERVKVKRDLEDK